jgi:probable Rubsico expression protein CbbX
MGLLWTDKVWTGKATVMLSPKPSRAGRIHRCRDGSGAWNWELGYCRWRCAGGVRRALCEFMGADAGIIILIGGFVFVGFMVLALVGVGRDERIGRVKDKPGRKKRGGTAPAQRRASRSRKRDRPKPLPADATVTFAAERKAADIDEVFEALDNDLVGLVPVKKKVQEIAALLLVDRARQRFGLDAPRPNLHMCFTGPPGTGKTTVALRMADLLHRLDYLEEGQLVHAMRDDLVGEYIGQTAPKTKRVLDRAMGGVLFIDEAYYLYRVGDSLDYGQEAIDILLQVMENDRDKLVVILAGYKDRMDEFFTSNPGMSSRIAHHLDFAAYELDELTAIGRLMLEQSRYYLSEDAEEAFRQYVTGQMDQPLFANARSVRNDLERARLRHAHRLASDLHRDWTRDDLMRLEPADILDSRADLLERNRS